MKTLPKILMGTWIGILVLNGRLCHKENWSFSREQKSMCPIRVPCFKSLGRLVAAEMNLQGWCFLCYSRDLTLTLSLGCPEPDCGEATSTAKMCVQFPWSVLLSLPQTSFSTLLLPSSVSNALMLSLSRVFYLQSIQFSRSVVSDSLWPHGLQHTRLPSPSPSPGAYSNSCGLPWKLPNSPDSRSRCSKWWPDCTGGFPEGNWALEDRRPVCMP